LEKNFAQSRKAPSGRVLEIVRYAEIPGTYAWCRPDDVVAVITLSDRLSGANDRRVALAGRRIIRMRYLSIQKIPQPETKTAPPTR
jgi:hypothetical protein